MLFATTNLTGANFAAIGPELTNAGQELGQGLEQSVANAGQQIRAAFGETASGYLPSAVAALGVLIVGWILALILAAIVRSAVGKLIRADWFSKWFEEKDDHDPKKIARGFGKGTFYLSMLFVLVGFFHTLGLTAVTEPLSAFLNQIFSYAPRLLAAGGLAFLAWAVASLLRFVVRKASVAADLDRRIGQQASQNATTTDHPSHATTPDHLPHATTSDHPPHATTTDHLSHATTANHLPLTKTLSESTYWLTYLLFLPAILDALAMPGLLTPVRDMVGRVLGFLPNLFAAALILGIGWFVARIVQRIITNLLEAIGADRLGEKTGFASLTGGTKISGILGLLAYILLLVPVIVGSLNALQIEAVTGPASTMLTKMFGALPGILAAILVVGIAWVVGRIISGLVENLLTRIGFDRLPAELGITGTTSPSPGGRTLSQIAGTIVMVAIILFAVLQALPMLGFDLLAGMLTEFLRFASRALMGVVIFGFGLFFAKLVGSLIRDSDIDNAKLLSMIARCAILALAGAMALQQTGLASEIVYLAFGLTAGAIAVAAAIAFGVGGRDAAKNFIEGFTKNKDHSQSSGNGKHSINSAHTERYEHAGSA